MSIKFSKKGFEQIVVDKLTNAATNMVVLMLKQSWANCQNQENEIEQLMRDPELKDISVSFHCMNTDHLSSEVDALLLFDYEFPLTLPLVVLVDRSDESSPPVVVHVWDKFILMQSRIAESHNSTISEIKKFLLREKD